MPATEQQRLKVLWEYRILDTVPEELFDDLTELAAKICGAPTAMISLVDEDRQWFKSRVGLSQTETARDISFCAHAILQRDLFIVPDATRDPRFKDSPLVVSDPKIRFYAGAPLVSPDGHAVGTLCVIDKEPRVLTADQQQALRVLARHVVSQLELRRHSRELAVARKAGENARVELGQARQELQEARAQLAARKRTATRASKARPARKAKTGKARSSRPRRGARR